MHPGFNLVRYRFTVERSWSCKRSPVGLSRRPPTIRFTSRGRDLQELKEKRGQEGFPTVATGRPPQCKRPVVNLSPPGETWGPRETECDGGPLGPSSRGPNCVSVESVSPGLCATPVETASAGPLGPEGPLPAPAPASGEARGLLGPGAPCLWGPTGKRPSAAPLTRSSESRTA